MVLHRRYVDDVLFESIEHLLKFGAYLNMCHCKIFFLLEQEKERKLSILDVEAF